MSSTIDALARPVAAPVAGGRFTWSYSALESFETCPRKYYHLKVLRDVKEPMSPWIEEGNKVHAALEQRLISKTPLPAPLSHYESYAARFDKFGERVVAERKLGLTEDFRETTFYARDCWFRCIMDVFIPGKTAYIGDWKTGKVKDDLTQLTMSACAVMLSNPEVSRCVIQYVWLAHDKTTGRVIDREELPTLWSDTISRVARMQDACTAGRFPPRPSGLCRGWCPVGRERCEYWAPKQERR